MDRRRDIRDIEGMPDVSEAAMGTPTHPKIQNERNSTQIAWQQTDEVLAADPTQRL